MSPRRAATEAEKSKTPSGLRVWIRAFRSAPAFDLRSSAVLRVVVIACPHPAPQDARPLFRSWPELAECWHHFHHMGKYSGTAPTRPHNPLWPSADALFLPARYEDGAVLRRCDRRDCENHRPSAPFLDCLV